MLILTYLWATPELKGEDHQSVRCRRGSRGGKIGVSPLQILLSFFKFPQITQGIDRESGCVLKGTPRKVSQNKLQDAPKSLPEEALFRCAEIFLDLEGKNQNPIELYYCYDKESSSMIQRGLVVFLRKWMQVYLYRFTKVKVQEFFFFKKLKHL